MVSEEARQLQQNQQALLHELEAAGAGIVSPKYIRCPFHEDRQPSGSLYQDDQAVWRFKCHADCCGFCGDVFDVRARRTGRPLEEVLREQSAATKAPPAKMKRPKLWPSVEAMQQGVAHCTQVYRYSDPETFEPQMVVMRIEEPGKAKRFIQARPEGGGWVMQAPPQPWPIYNRRRVLNSERVVVVEGEKCVHALHELGIVATTSPGGAGKAAHADWSPLAGKAVYVWPDCDKPDPKTGRRSGLEHMREVVRQLERLEPEPTIYWVDPDYLGLPPKGDVVDYIAQHVDCDDEARRYAVEAVLQDAEPTGASTEIKALIEDTISGKRQSIRWPWTFLGNLTKALLPGMLTVVCGDPGSAKSFMVLQAAAYWHEQGFKVAVFELEDDRAYHLYRALAQRSGMSVIFDDEWVRNNPDQARHIHAEHQQFLDSFGRCIHEAPDEHVTLNDLAAWVERMANAGCDIIIVDPVTAAATSDKPWIDDLKFIMQTKAVVKRTKSRLILVTHPKKGRKGSSFMEDMAGGAAYSRFTPTVLWLETYEPPETFTVRSLDLPVPQAVSANRVIKIRKARNGRGAGKHIAYRFDGGSLRFEELGLVLQEGEA